MRPLARELLAGREDAPVRLVYGTATATNTVRVDGEATAVAMPALSPVVSGDRVAILKAGGDRLIVGPIGGPRVEHGDVSDTTDGSGDITITFGSAFSSAPDVVCTREANTPNERTWHIQSVSTTGFVARAFNGGTVATGQPFSLHWIAVGN